MRCGFAFVLVLSISSLARATVLYDGSSDSSPTSRGYLIFPSLPNVTQSSAGGVTTFDSTAAKSAQGGWFNPAPLPTMDRSGNGYVVSLDMKVLSQSTDNNDRAGISLIALSSDHVGVEIAFFTNEIWAYDFSDPPPTFTHGEGHTFTTTTITTYDLAIHGSTYELFAGGNSILTGNLRDYSPRGLVYGNDNFVWLGDDTTESSGSFEFSRLEITNATPEPAMISIASIGLLALFRRAR